ncbi:MAG TPA: DeoR/GlpR family DNA-binding transcription regulator [Anaerolinea sp.]|nr:DeoR/GlpR family DNA-binding transcription regulator [Anaerolinea sp.]
MATTKLFPEERYRKILQELESSGRISVEDLSKAFGISQVTIRSDLQYLASQKLLVRTHGGAISAPRLDDEPPFDSRIDLHTPEKERIGRAAAALVNDGDVIGLDASTTALAIATHLANKQDLTIVTNGLALANRMLMVPGITLYLVGGFLRRDALSLIGHLGEDFLAGLNMQTFFVSAHGLSVQEGLTEMSAQEAAVKESFIRHARMTIAVLDSSKIGRVSLHSFAPLENIQTIITNADAPLEQLDKMKTYGVEIILA